MLTGENFFLCLSSYWSYVYIGLQVTTTECANQLSFRTEEKCETKPDKECRIKTKIVQVPEEQIKLVRLLICLLFMHTPHPHVM